MAYLALPWLAPPQWQSQAGPCAAMQAAAHGSGLLVKIAQPLTASSTQSSLLILSALL
jgi:hypothetical protein